LAGKRRTAVMISPVGSRSRKPFTTPNARAADIVKSGVRETAMEFGIGFLGDSLFVR
jgi:hypothetical protein